MCVARCLTADDRMLRTKLTTASCYQLAAINVKNPNKMI